MASELKIFSIYKLENEDKFYLLRTERPSFSNTSQNHENLANEIEQNKRELILNLIAKKYNKNNTDFKFLGELQGYPIGDILYSKTGNFELNIYFMETEFGQPWIIIGNSESETEFLKELYDDEDLSGLKPIGNPKQIKATLITENDFDLSTIEKFKIEDIRPN